MTDTSCSALGNDVCDATPCFREAECASASGACSAAGFAYPNCGLDESIALIIRYVFRLLLRGDVVSCCSCSCLTCIQWTCIVCSLKRWKLCFIPGFARNSYPDGIRSLVTSRNTNGFRGCSDAIVLTISGTVSYTHLTLPTNREV